MPASQGYWQTELRLGRRAAEGAGRLRHADRPAAQAIRPEFGCLTGKSTWPLYHVDRNGSGRSAAELAVNVSKVPAATAQLSSRGTRLLMTKLLVGAVIGLCAGALIGGLTFAALGADATATAFLRLRNPADLIAIAGGANQITPDNQDNTSTFVAGEIAYLSGDGFAEALRTRMAKDGPVVLNIAQAAKSAVVTISCSSASSDEAVRTVQAAIDLYREQLEQRADVQLRTVLPKLDQWQQRDNADATRIQELQRVRESVELQSTESAILLVEQPPTTNHPSTQQWVIGVFLGALVGGSCAAAVVLARSRRSGRGALVKTLTEIVDGVLVPVVDLDLPPRSEWADEQARLARTLYAQCPSAGPDRLILVIGASSSSGSSEVASLLEFAAAENQLAAPAVLSSGQHSSPASAEPPTTRVVSGGIVGDSTLSPGVLGVATDIVVVARLDADTVAQAMVVRSATASSTASVVAVFTHRRRRGARSRARQPNAAAQASSPR